MGRPEMGPPVVVFPSPLAGQAAARRPLLRIALGMLVLASASMVVDALGRTPVRRTAPRDAPPTSSVASTAGAQSRPTAQWHDTEAEAPSLAGEGFTDDEFAPARGRTTPPPRAMERVSAPARDRTPPPRATVAPRAAGSAAVRAARAPADSGWLVVSSKPWGTLWIDGREIGPTPQPHVRLSAGTHRVVVRRNGYADLVADVTIMRGVEQRLTRLVLRALP